MINAARSAAAIATAPTAPRASAALTGCWRPSVIGRPGRISWSLPKAMFEPQKETEPTIALKSEEDRDVQRLGVVAAGVAELRPRDQRHRATADAVEERDHLRHRGHLHVAGRRHADGGADHHAEDHQAPVAEACVSSVATTAIAMPTAAIALPRLAVRGRRQARQPVDEQAEGDDVAGLMQVTWKTEVATITIVRAAVGGRLGLGPRPQPWARLGLEHGQHAVGDHEAADDVRSSRT